MRSKQGPRTAGMRTTANAAGRRHQEPQRTDIGKEATA
ncbi:hypothetical protein ACUXPM_000022 [Ralstonia sp. 151470066-2]|jgi:hypothetical protein